MNCKAWSGLVFLVFMLSGCVTDPSIPKSKTTTASDETVSFRHLGDFWCLLNPDGKSREQIREISLEDWEAYESKVQGSSGYATCDVSFTIIKSGEPPCSNPPNPASSLVGGRITIKRIPFSDTFNVSLKDSHNDLYPQLGILTMNAQPGVSSGTAKWLYRANVPWTDGTPNPPVEYDIYIYMVDEPAARDIPKHYRIEFFNRKTNGCIDEEPINNNMISPPWVVGSPGCGNTYGKGQKMWQAPIGDGHHYAPNAQQVCVY